MLETDNNLLLDEYIKSLLCNCDVNDTRPSDLFILIVKLHKFFSWFRSSTPSLKLLHLSLPSSAIISSSFSFQWWKHEELLWTRFHFDWFHFMKRVTDGCNSTSANKILSVLINCHQKLKKAAAKPQTAHKMLRKLAVAFLFSQFERTSEV